MRTLFVLCRSQVKSGFSRPYFGRGKLSLVETLLDILILFDSIYSGRGKSEIVSRGEDVSFWLRKEIIQE